MCVYFLILSLCGCIFTLCVLSVLWLVCFSSLKIISVSLTHSHTQTHHHSDFTVTSLDAHWMLVWTAFSHFVSQHYKLKMNCFFLSHDCLCKLFMQLLTYFWKIFFLRERLTFMKAEKPEIMKSKWHLSVETWHTYTVCFAWQGFSVQCSELKACAWNKVSNFLLFMHLSKTLNP